MRYTVRQENPSTATAILAVYAVLYGEIKKNMWFFFWLDIWNVCLLILYVRQIETLTWRLFPPKRHYWNGRGDITAMFLFWFKFQCSWRTQCEVKRILTRVQSDSADRKQPTRKARQLIWTNRCYVVFIVWCIFNKALFLVVWQHARQVLCLWIIHNVTSWWITTVNACIGCFGLQRIS